MFSRFKKVDFFVVGAQKSGTTALYQYLRKHPQIGVPERKELHHFDNDSIMQWPRLYREWRYHCNFKACSDRQLLGEVTPCYMFEPRYLERIFNYNHRSKLIVILRDPVHRAYSHWNMQRLRGIEARDFATAVRDELALGYRDKRFAYIARGLYGKQFEAILGRFPLSQVLVLLQVDLLFRPCSVLAQISPFLGVERWPVVENVRAHEGIYDMRLPEKDVLALRHLFRKDLNKLEQLLGTDFSAWT